MTFVRFGMKNRLPSMPVVRPLASTSESTRRRGSAGAERASDVQPGLRRNRLHAAVVLAVFGSMAASSGASAGTDQVPDLVGLVVEARRLGVSTPAASWAFAKARGLGHLLPQATRADIPVTNCNDSGPGSLRNAIATAASGDRVDARTLGCGTITLTSGQLQVFANNLTIIGPGRDALVVRNGVAPGPSSRVIHHTGTGTLTVSAVTIADGDVVGVAAAPDVRGGCILSNGTVVLGTVLGLGTSKYDARVRDCSVEGHAGGQGKAAGGGIAAEAVLMGNSIVTGCRAISHGEYRPVASGGGGIFARARIGLAASEISGNLASGNGKYMGGGGVLLGVVAAGGEYRSTIVGTTISGNTAVRGGGAMLLKGANVVNSTISGNIAREEGGGLWTAGLGFPRINLWNSTVAANRMLGENPERPNGGGLFAEIGAEVNMQSSLIAGNLRAGNVPDDVGGGNVLIGSNNLISAWFGSPALPPGTIVGNANLLPLADNGGRTRTHALGPGSLAINAGNNANGSTFDQRGEGFPRVLGPAADIGAIEYSLVDIIFANGFDQ